ncbi:MAG TPA: electron transfer flavoprotein subunit beta/FixA family protein [Anaerolineae bacterium]|nr:electron transfer flavoprotein subunit beta/FixA family protein [Anaerolineae bacterium]
MKIVVCMKQVVDLAQLRYKSDGRTPVLDGMPMILGDFEKNALEEAVRIKESRDDVQVIALSVGSPKLKETIKEALAMGADEAVLVIDPGMGAASASGSSHVLAAAVEKIGDVDLILLGEGSDDEYSGQVPSRMAAGLELPQITTVRELEWIGEARLRATRDLENTLEVMECDLPVVISVTSEMNTPRLPPLTAILKAGRKPIQEWTLADLNLEPQTVRSQSDEIEALSNLAPAQDRKNVMFEGTIGEQVEALLRALEHEGVLS